MADHLGKKASDIPSMGNMGATEAQTGWQAQDAWIEAFGDGSNAPIIIDPLDGLPRPADDNIDGSAPALTEDSFICMADERVWVPATVDDLPEGLPTHVYHAALGTGHEWDENGQPAKQAQYTFDELKKAYGLMWVVDGTGALMCPVRPIRKKCEHLTRQLITDQTLSSTEGPVVPLASFCRGFLIDGEPMSLADQAVWACERRSPRDFVTEEKIIERVRKKIAQGKESKSTPVFAAAPQGPKWQDQAAQYDWPLLVYDVPADPAVAPGKQGRLIIDSPAHVVVPGAVKCDELCIVGTEWMPSEIFSSKHFPGSGYHTCLLQPHHLSGLAEPPPEWLANWPARIDPHLGMACKNQPAALAKFLRAGKTVLVTAARREHAMWYAALILVESGNFNAASRVLPLGVSFPEGIAHFAQRYPHLVTRETP